MGGTTGKSAVVDIDTSKISVQRSIGILRPNKDQVLPKFLDYAIQADYSQKLIWEIAVKYAAQPGIYLDDLARMKFAIPPVREQKEIISYLKSVDESYAKVIGGIMKEIHRLNEFKQLIISEAVTGKIKI